MYFGKPKNLNKIKSKYMFVILMKMKNFESDFYVRMGFVLSKKNSKKRILV